jgi:hypothetical protein
MIFKNSFVEVGAAIPGLIESRLIENFLYRAGRAYC